MALPDKLRGRGAAPVTQLLGERRLESRRSATRSAATQAVLRQGWQLAAAAGQSLPAPAEAGFQEFSNSDEDGILLYLFAVLGIHNGTFVDVGAAGVEGSNTANLAVNHGWWGLHIEGRQAALDFSQSWYGSVNGSRLYPPVAVQAMVNAENINSLIADNGLNGEIDLLSVDIDSNDYWIWRAIDVVTPRVVVIEYQTAVGHEAAVTIPYEPNFDRSEHAINQPPAEIVYAGASLAALIHLGNERGYTLVAVDRMDSNGIFVRNDVLDGRFPAVDPASCFKHPRSQHLIATYREKLLKMPWEHIS